MKQSLLSRSAAVAVTLLATGVLHAANLTWDADPGSAGANDGTGTWDTVATNWWDGAANTNWDNVAPDRATFGVGGAGGVVTIAGPVSVSGLTFNAVSGANTYTLSGGTMTLVGSVPVAVNATAAIDATIAGNGFVKSGNSTLTLGGANSFTGNVTVSVGILTVTNGDALGVAPLVQVNNNQKLRLAGNIVVTGRTVSINGNGGADNSGALQSALFSTNTWDGRVIMATDQARLGVQTGSTLIVSGVIDHNGTANGLAIRNDNMTGWVVLSGANTYSGKTAVVIGRLQLAGADNRLPTNTVLEIGNTSSLQSALVDMNGVSQQIAGLTDLGSGMAKVVTNSSATLAMLTFMSTNSYATANGTVLAGNLALVKSGSGTQSLRSAVNTYTGGTTINGGTLSLGADGTGTENSRGLGNGPVTINAGGTLRLGGSTNGTVYTITNVLTLAGGTIWAQEGIQHLTNATLAVAAGGGTIVTVNGSKDVWVGHLMTGSGPLTVDNASSTTGGMGTVRFAHPGNTYDGTVTVNGPSAGFLGGRIAIHGDTSLAQATLVMNGTNSIGWGTAAPMVGALAGSGDIGISSGITFSVGSKGTSTTYGGVFYSFGTLVKTGGGVLTLTGNGTLSGTVTINAGSLALGAGGTLSNATVMLAGGTFDVTAHAPFVVPPGAPVRGSGIVSGAVVAVDAAQVSPGGEGTAGTLVVAGSLSMNAGYTNRFDLTNSVTIGGGVNDLLEINGNLEPSGSVIRVNELVPLGNGAYRLVNYTGSRTSSFNPAVQHDPSHKTWTLDESTPGQINLVISGSYGNLRWHPLVSTNWNSSEANWFDVDALTTNVFLTFDSVLFDDIGAAAPDVNLAAVVRPTAVVVNSSSNYTIGGTGRITGATGILKDGPGTLTLGGAAHDYAGEVVVSNGMLKLVNGASLGSRNTGTAIRGGTLDINGVSANASDMLTISGDGFAGTGSVINSGAIQDRALRGLILADNASISAWGNRWDIRGTNVIDLAGYRLTKRGAGVIYFVEMTMTNAGDIDIAEGRLAIARGANSGAGVVGIPAGASLSLENFTAGYFDKAVALSGGTFRVAGNAMTTTARVDVTGSSVIEAAGVTLRFVRPITGSGGFTKTGDGTLVLASTNTHAGLTLIANSGGRTILDSAAGPALAAGLQLGTLNGAGGEAMAVCSNDNQIAAGGVVLAGSPGDWASLRLMGTVQTLASIMTDDIGGAAIENAYTDNGIADDGVLVIDGASDSIFSGSIMRDSVPPGTSTGKLRLIQAGSGTLALAGAGTNMTFSGGVVVSNGVLNVKALNAAGVGTITLAGGTLALDGAGLQEGRIATSTVDTTSSNPLNSGVKLSTKRANLTTDFATSTTWAYTGYLVVTGTSAVTYSFAENFDDTVWLSIDGSVILNNGSHNTPTIGTITLSPGHHRFDLRLHNGTSGAGPVNSSWWNDTSLGIGYDPLGRNDAVRSNYIEIADSGSGTFLCTDVTVTNTILLQADSPVRAGLAVGVTNTLGGTIGDGGSGFGITKTGAGILRLAGVNTYGGTTVVSNGTLLVDGFNIGAGAFTVLTNASLWGTGTLVAASATVEAGGSVGPRPGTASAGTLSVVDLTLDSGSSLHALLNGTNPTLRTTGDLTVSAGVGVVLSPVAPVTVGTNVLIDYDGAFNGSIGNFNLLSIPNGAQGYLVDNTTDTRIDLVITNAGAGVRWDGAIDGVWDIAGTANWKSILSGSTTLFNVGDAVLFDDTATGSYTIDILSPVNVASLSISNETQDYVFNGASVGGSFGLAKYGAASLTLNNANSFTGATWIGAGRLAIVGETSLGPVPVVTTPGHLGINAGAELEMLASGAINSRRGMSVGPSSGAGVATVSIASGAVVTISSVIADTPGGTGTFVKAGSGTLVLPASGTYSGGTIVDDGLVQLPTAGGVGGSAIPKGTPLTVRNGATLELIGGTAIGQGPGNPSVVTIDVARVTTVAGTHQDTPLVVMRGGRLSSEGPGDQYGNYIHDSTNFVVLADALPSVIDAVSFDLRGSYSTPTYLVNFFVEDGAAEHDLFVTAQLMDFPGQSGKLVKSGPGAMTIATAPSTNIYSGWTLVNGGTLMLGTNNAVALPRGPVTNNARLVLNLLSGVVSNYIGGTGVVVQTGSGVTELTASSDYSGGTQISNGTLQVSGAIGAGPVTIAAGATLGGTGTVAGAVTSDGSVAPGASAGTLTLSAGYTQNAGGSLDIELGGTSQGISYDYLSVGGTATLGGALNVTFINGFTGTVGDVYVVLNAGVGVSGTFASTNLPALPGGATWDVQYVGTFVLLTINSGTPPAGYDLFAGQIPNPVDRGYQNDPDGDGYANLLEYVTGGDPTNSDVVARMNAARTNGLLVLKFTRNTNAVDATLLVEASYATTNDATWTGIATNLAGSWGGAPNVLESGTNTPLSVTVADTVPAATNRFLRLRVSRP